MDKLKEFVSKRVDELTDNIQTKYKNFTDENKETTENSRKDIKRNIDILKEDIIACNIRIDNFNKDKGIEGGLLERLVKLEVNTETIKEDFKKIKER